MHIYRYPSRELLCSLPKLPFFYVIRHKRTGKFYAGYKKKLPNPSMFMAEGSRRKAYKTSSGIIHTIIKSEGVDAFTICRIRLFDSGLKANQYEHRFLVRVKASDNPIFYNRNNGAMSPSPGWHHSKETCNHLSKIRAGNLNPFYGKSHSQEVKNLQSFHSSGGNNPRYGCVISDGQKRKYSLSVKGFVWWNDSVSEKRSAECPGHGWKRGRSWRKP
jgi:hypothetical protein